ncbi:MAG: type II secretion system protein [Planctomycetota bacterium]|nr:type II secretion system protein [Planctomycetota bacterium]
MCARNGFTLTEMLAVIGVILCLSALLVPALTEVKDTSDSARCAANLSQIGKALLIYAAENDGFLPSCGAYSKRGDAPARDGKRLAGRWNAQGTCNWPKFVQVGNQANLWLLVRAGYADPRQFVCPATPDRPSLNAADDPSVMGFLQLVPDTAAKTPAEAWFVSRVTAARCSYSYQNQFVHPKVDPLVSDSRNATYNVLVHSSALPIMADRNPYTRLEGTNQPVLSPDEFPEANSLNHHGAGQNVLFLGGEVEWFDTPCCGLRDDEGFPDNIYTPKKGSPTDPENIPFSLDDTYLVP